MDSMSPQPTTAGSAQLLPRFHRHMRGRYFLATVLGLMVGAAGAFAGYSLFGPVYKSTGILRITPLTLRILYAGEVSASVFDSFVDVQINLLRSRPVILAALKNPNWIETHAGDAPMEPEIFLRNLEITHLPRGELIDVAFTDKTPAGAKAGVRAVIESYLKLNADQSTSQRVQVTEERGEQLKSQLAKLSKRIGDITQKYGTDDLKLLHQAKTLELSRLEGMIMDTEINLILAESALGKSDATQNMPASEIGATDDLMRRLLEERDNTETKLAEQLLTRGNDHPDVVAVRTRLESLNKEIKARAEAFRKFNRSGVVNEQGVLKGMPTQASVDSLKQRRDGLRKLYKDALQKSLDIGSTSLEIGNLQDEHRKIRDLLTSNQANVEQLRVDSSVVGQITALSTGDLPREPIKDRRRTMAAAGGCAGFALGFGLIAALSFTDHRLRRVADLACTSIDLPVLGIFPRSRGRARVLAAKAASALHETLTGLQIDPQLSAIRVLAISSASPGEGKSEMAAALAVGFAALGKRTLLIDFDLRQAELTRQLKSGQGATGKGLLDALAGEKVTTCQGPTKVPLVSFLPMQGQGTNGSSGLTSAQIRSVLAQAAAAFEIVVLDTPPILGGLESTLICKEAETLLLAITPSTSDRVLARAVDLLRTSGAIVGGILFNQAAGADIKVQPFAASEKIQPFQPSPMGSFIEVLMTRESTPTPSK